MAKLKIGGDLGDGCFALSIASQIPGGPHEVHFVDQEGRCTRDFTKRSPLLIPLFEKQPYIKSAKNSKAQADYDFTEFRNFHGNTTTLPQAQAIYINSKYGLMIKDHGTTPWLKVKTSMKTRSGVVIARSDRYQNERMPWKKIVEHYGWSRITFVGLPDEHARFCHAFGAVPHQKVKDFWELAQIIKESVLFIGNQSSPMALAIGMGHAFIQEVCETQPDCVFNRDNAQYVIDGSCLLPDINDSGALEIAAPDPDVSHYSRDLVPPGFWEYPGLPSNCIFSTQKNLVKQIEQCDDAAADEKLLRYNVKTKPSFFNDRGNAPFEAFQTAHKKAFGAEYKPPSPTP